MSIRRSLTQKDLGFCAKKVIQLARSDTISGFGKPHTNNHAVSAAGLEFNANAFETTAIYLPESQAITAGEFSADFKEILELFNGKKETLFRDWLLRTRLRFAGETEIHHFRYLVRNRLDLEKLTFEDKPALLSVELDLTAWSKGDLEAFLNKIREIPLFSLRLSGTSALPIKELHNFLEQFDQVELIQVKNELEKATEKKEEADETQSTQSLSLSSLAAFSAQLSYRNCLIRTLLRDERDLGEPWESLLREWNTLLQGYETENTAVYFLKQMDSRDETLYGINFRKLFWPETSSDQLIDDSYAGFPYAQYSLVNACVEGAGPLFFRAFLTYFQRASGQPEETTTFYLNSLLTEEYMELLGASIHLLPFTEIRLYVNEKIINSEAFLGLLKKFKNAKLQELQLCFYKDELVQKDKSLSDSFLTKILPQIDYPVKFLVYYAGLSALRPLAYHSNTFNKFGSELIKKIRAKNRAQLLSLEKKSDYPGESKISLDFLEHKESSPDPLGDLKEEPSTSFSKKITLNNLMGEDCHPLQVQHLTEAKHVLRLHHEDVGSSVPTVHEVKTVAIEEKKTELHDIFEGELIDLNKFNRNPYSARQLSAWVDDYFVGLKFDVDREFFAKTPHSIHYFTHRAAIEISKNICNFSALNFDNLPRHFFCKRTKNGERVLDYDPHFERKEDAFTPKVSHYRDGRRPAVFYDQSEIDSLRLHDYLQDEVLLNNFKKYDLNQHGHPFKNYLLNTWVRFGVEGIRRLLKIFKLCDQRFPEFSSFLYIHYLRYFHDWDHFLDSSFITTLEKINDYSQAQLECLKMFLAESGVSRADFSDLVKGFEKFWQEWQELCSQNQLPTDALHLIKMKMGLGNRLVYMQRLLRILKNARNLKEQLAYFKEEGVDLANYGGYYASQYEGFKLISNKMKFSYVVPTALAEKDKKTIYRVSWNDLLEKSISGLNETEELEFTAWVYRLIGQHEKIIELNNYTPGYEKFLHDYATSPLRFLAVTFSLKFIANDYTGQPALNDLLVLTLEALTSISSAEDRAAWCHLFAQVEENLQLRAEEGAQLMMQLKTTNAQLKEAKGSTNFRQTSEQLFYYLGKNKPLTFKVLDRLTKIGQHPRALGAVLETARFLQEDLRVKNTYWKEVLFFSALIEDTAPVYPDGVIGNHTQLELQELREALADTPQPNNLDYAFKTLVQANLSFGWPAFMALFREIKKLKQFNPLQVNHLLTQHGFHLGSQSSFVIIESDKDLKELLIQLLKNIYSLQNQVPTEEAPTETEELLASMSIDQLIEQLQKNHASIQRSTSQPLFPLWNKVKETLVAREFKDQKGGFATSISALLRVLPEFQESKDGFQFVLKSLKADTQAVVRLLQQIQEMDGFPSFEENYVNLFKQIDGLKFDSKHLLALLRVLAHVPIKDHLFLIEIFIQKQKINFMEFKNFLDRFNALVDESTDSQQVLGLARIWASVPGASLRQDESAFNQLTSHIQRHPKDPLLAALLKSGHRMEMPAVRSVLRFMDEETDTEKRRAVAQFLNKLNDEKQTDKLRGFLLDECLSSPALFIIAKSHNCYATKDPLDLRGLLADLNALSENEHFLLTNHFKTNTVSLPCLHSHLMNYLKLPRENRDFKSLLFNFERSPYGVRPLDIQFDSSTAERVVDETENLLHHAKYAYERRQKILEALLFVNAIGNDLPFYPDEKQNLAPAQALSNEQLQALFKAASTMEHLNSTQKGLYVLGLLREVMYRATGQFAYPVQLIPLLDYLLDEKNHADNIDTGQGKSLIDQMKSALMWSSGYCVDITTESLTESCRDIETYGPFLSMLGIPYSKDPIAAESPKAHYKNDGINFTTFPDLSLFHSNQTAQGENLDSSEEPPRKPALIVNESDQALLEDLTVYRLASAATMKLNYGREWVYYAINHFIQTQEHYFNGTYTANALTGALRRYLFVEAQRLKKDPLFLKTELSSDDYLNLLGSALRVKHKLREKQDYVILPEPESKVINGEKCLSRVIGIVGRNGTVASSSTTYGRGMQQFLCAHLNVKLNLLDQPGKRKFELEPETKVLISKNNKNLVDRYLRRGGKVLLSSATLGSDAAIKEQTKKYGFSFKRLARHQRSRVVINEPKIYARQNEKLNKLKDLVFSLKKKDKNNMQLVYCKDIKTTEALMEALKADKRFSRYFKLDEVQLYLGGSNRAQIVSRAGNPGMLTLTTPALARNVDIQYDRKKGLKIIHSCVVSEEGYWQINGRTNRQDSEGTVYTLLDATDLGLDEGARITNPRAAIREKQQALARQLKMERDHNEGLYDVLGAFERRINLLQDWHFRSGKKSEFIKTAWSQFTHTLEANYRKHNKQVRVGSSETFFKKSLPLFMTLLETHCIFRDKEDPLGLRDEVDFRRIIEMDVFNHYPHASKEPAPIYTKKVTVKECLSPEVMACHFSSLPNAEEKAAEDLPLKEQVKNQLRKFFAAIHTGRIGPVAYPYLKYLRQNPISTATIRAAHHEFLADFLENAQQNCFWHRWFGFKTHLDTVLNDKNYILLFSAMIRINGEGNLIELDTLKRAVTALLIEYRDCSWFINQARAHAVRDLISQVKEVNSYPKLLQLLAETKNSALDEDIKGNQTRLKSLNISGSRFQEKLNAACRLVQLATRDNKLVEAEASLSENFVKHLEKLVPEEPLEKKLDLESSSSSLEPLSFFKKNATYDDLKTLSESLTSKLCADPSNAKVALQTMRFHLETTQLLQPFKL